MKVIINIEPENIFETKVIKSYIKTTFKTELIKRFKIKKLDMQII
jgi:hypothetical protein